jgi:hypothetical protein
MVGAAFALILPDQSWYSTLLIALVAMTGYVELLVFPFATTLLYLADGDFGTVLDRDARIARYAFLLFVAVLAVRLLLVRSRSTRTA